jgi:phosphatidylglycerophosphatase A
MSEPRPDAAPDASNRCCSFLAVWLATGFGTGKLPVASGTVGAAIWGLPLAWWIGDLRLAYQLLVIVLLCAIGVPICTAAARALGDKKDPGAIVWDEMASVPITFLLVPMSHVMTIAVGFALNRLFDIAKPYPIRRLERLPNGLGVMADDWVAGVYSCLVIHCLLWIDVLPSQGG